MMKRPSNQLLNFRKLLPAIVTPKRPVFEKSGSPDPVTEPALMQEVVIAKILPQIQLALLQR